MLIHSCRFTLYKVASGGQSAYSNDRLIRFPATIRDRKKTGMKIVMSIEGKIERLSSLCPGGFLVAIRMGFFFPVYEKNTLPAKWTERYTARGYMVADPVLHWCYQNLGAKRWSALTEEDPRGVLSQARLHGLNYGLAASCIDPDNPSQRSFGSFTRADREFKDSEIVEISELLEDLHVELVPPKNLTDAELEALRMVKNGLLMKEIANLLGVSEGAVKQRLKNAKSKLRAKTSTQAATMATSFGLI